MAKIRTLKEEMLIGGTSQEQIYPRTTTKAVYTTDGKLLQEVIDDTKSGAYLNDKAIKTRHLDDKSVTADKIADNAVNSSMISDGSITEAKMAINAVDTVKIKDAAITGNKIATDAIETTKIKDKAITEAKIAEDAIGTANIKDKTITGDKIANNTITSSNLTDAAVSTSIVEDKAITHAKLEDKAVDNDKMADASVDNRVLDDASVSTEKIVDESVTSQKIREHTINEGNMASDAISTRTIVDENVTERKLSTDSVSTTKIINEAVTTSKIKDGAVTNDKLADKTIAIDKLDEKLKGAIEAATGMPEDLMKQFLAMSDNISELQDTVYPITLSLNVSYVAPAYSVSFTVRNQGQPFVGDTLLLSKTLANGTVKTLSNIPASDGVASTTMESNREIFTLTVGAKGHTTKSVSTTRYTCYAGSNEATSITETVIDKLQKYSTTGVSFNPKVTTANNQYIWLIVPQHLTISKVTSSGFDVPLSTVQNITTSLGVFKAYRTVNALAAATWNLVIS